MYHSRPRRDPRSNTRRVLDLVEQGVLSHETVMAACLNYLSESEVADLARREGFFDHEEEDA